MPMYQLGIDVSKNTLIYASYGRASKGGSKLVS